MLRRTGSLAAWSSVALRCSVRKPRYSYTFLHPHPATAKIGGLRTSRTYATVKDEGPKDDGKEKKAGSLGNDGATKSKPAANEQASSESPPKVAPKSPDAYNSKGASDLESKQNDDPTASTEMPGMTSTERAALDDLITKLKQGLPAGQAAKVDAAFAEIKRNGIPKEVREIMTQIKEGKGMDLSTAARLLRVTTQMARKAAENMHGAAAKDSETLNDKRPGQSSPSPGAEKKNGKKDEKKGFSLGDVARLDTGTLITLAILGYTAYLFLSPADNAREITWQEFRTTFFDKGLVEKLTVVNGHRVRVDLHRQATGQMYPESPAARGNFHYYFSIGSVEAFERKIDDAQKELDIPSSERIPVAYRDEMSWAGPLLSFGPTIALIVGIYFLSRRAGGAAGGQSGIFGIGKSRAKMFNHETDIKVKFKDVAGMDEAKQEIMEFVSFLKEPGQFQRLGAKIPRGAILSGPPGTGKTLLAKATAGESSVPFYSVSGSEFVEMFVGVGPSRVRDLFAKARKNTPCIIFIDEIDAIGKSRSKANFGGGNDERESTLNQILTEMDGFNTSDQVVVLAGTNRPDVLDKALMRPGRFDRHISIDNPTMEGRKQIFNVHVQKIVTSEDMDFLSGRFAALTPGFSGADIANCVNEAALIGRSHSARSGATFD